MVSQIGQYFFIKTCLPSSLSMVAVSPNIRE
nr:MAG TPA: hypothetical protein [Bacteriophage sp.]